MWRALKRENIYFFFNPLFSSKRNFDILWIDLNVMVVAMVQKGDNSSSSDSGVA